MSTVKTRPTDRWLATVAGMPALEGPAGTAERLLLLVHYGVNWDSWVGGRRVAYWSDVLPDRVLTATFMATTLRQWWGYVSAELESRPRNPGERAELEQLLREDAGPVLEVLRAETEALLLRVRIVSESVRDSRKVS